VRFLSIRDGTWICVYFSVVAGLLGAVLGSFLNCAAWRIAHEEPFWKGRSHCPACGHTLGAADLVPVFSWLFLRGRCRYCGEKISPRYPVTELLFALITLCCLWRFDLTVEALRNWILFCCLYCLSLVDLEVYLIPNGALILGAAAWLAALPFMGYSWLEIGGYLLAAVVFGGGMLLISLVLDKVLGRESLGGGDVKLFALVGLYLGLAGTLFALMAACVLGLIFAGLRRLIKGTGGQLPFGPAIAAAAAGMLLWGDGLIGWYLSLF